MIEGNKSNNGYGVASLVLGIIGLVLSFFIIGAVLSVLAIVFAVLQRKKNKNGVATSGLVLGIIGATIGILILLYMIILSIGLLSLFSSFVNLNRAYANSIHFEGDHFDVSQFSAGDTEDTLFFYLENTGNDAIVKSIEMKNIGSGGTYCSFLGERALSAGESARFIISGCEFGEEPFYNTKFIINYTQEDGAFGQDVGIFSAE